MCVHCNDRLQNIRKRFFSVVIIMQSNETGLRPSVQCVKIIDIIISVSSSTPEVWENNLKKEHMV